MFLHEITSLQDALTYRIQCYEERFSEHTVINHARGVWNSRELEDLNHYTLEQILGAGWVLVSYMTQPETPWGPGPVGSG